MTTARQALVERLNGFDAVVEVGVGRRPAVAGALTERGVDVTTTDVVECDVPDGVAFVRDDVTDPDLDVYSGCDAVYGLNLPPELHRPAWDVARECGANLLFTTLGGDQPAISVEREMLPEGETLFLAREDVPGNGPG